MIPKKIHYCWFGHNSKSDLINQCIESWKKYAPDYEIIEWNENNYDVNKYRYSKEAYNIKKYAFVSDVARFDILYEYGGIYLDTDVELYKPIDCFLDHNVFMGYDQRGLIASGLILGSIAKNNFLSDILSYYRNTTFIMKNGKPNMTTVVTIVSEILRNNDFNLDGLYCEKNGVVLYPAEFFDPYDYENNLKKIGKNTFALHHYAASWKTRNDIKIYNIGRFIKKIVGNKIYEKLARFKHRMFG